MDQLSNQLGTALGNFQAWANNPISQLLLIPLLGCLFIASLRSVNLRGIRIAAVVFSSLTLLVTLGMWIGVPKAIRDNSPALEQYEPFSPQAGVQFHLPAEQYKWISIEVGQYQSLSVNWNTGVDGLSLPLVTLCSSLFFLATLWALKRKEKIREFFALMFLLQVGVSGVFVALDFILFYLFWEMMLLPMYFLIAGFGREKEAARRAAMKFFLFTMGGSVFFLIAAIAMKVLSGIYSFDMLAICQAAFDPSKMGYLPLGIRLLMFTGLLLAFAVKVPLFPLHTWLPDAHTEAPTEVSVILAGIMLKTGGYAMLRMLYFAFPDVGYAVGPVIATLAVISIVYGAAVTVVQTDFKRMVAYSSISHMGFVVLGISSMNADGTIGALFHMVGHGVIISLLFFLSGVIERRYGTRDLRLLGGMLRLAPAYSPFVVLAAVASMGFPFLIGFWGELEVLKGAFYNNPNWESVHVGAINASTYLQWLAVVACLGILTTAIYMLRMMLRLLGGRPPAYHSTLMDKAPAIAQPELLAGTTPRTPEQRLAWAGLAAGSPMAASFELSAAESADAQAALTGSTEGSDGEDDEALTAEVEPAEAARPGDSRPWRGLARNEALPLIALGLTVIILGFNPNAVLNAVSLFAGAMMQLYMAF